MTCPCSPRARPGYGCSKDCNLRHAFLALEKEYAKVCQRLEPLEITVAERKAYIAGLQTENDQIRERCERQRELIRELRCSNLETRNKELEALDRNKELKEEVEEYVKEVIQRRDQVVALRAENRKLEARNRELEGEIKDHNRNLEEVREYEASGWRGVSKRVG